MVIEKRKQKLQLFKQTVINFYKKEGRKFPWRETRDSYRILVSEIMLQQTQAARVIEKFNTFIAAFPTVEKLSVATDKEVLSLWNGLGYNRRGLNLKRAAQEIVTRYKGIIPQDPLLLQTLPGIGPYTARAILAFAFNKPVVFIETNIRTALISFFFPGKQTVTDKELLPLVEATLDTKNPHRWYSALFDYGAHLKKNGNKTHRKSSQYKKQSTFKGSMRELRGKIIRLFLKKNRTVAGLIQETGDTKERVILALDALQKEKLITKIGNSYQIL